ncbi:hypothetical protein DdX_19620 [Ditylenchus destructor]|uniref:Uncharacterized protein n=1 Tax=Ditylenchus destructor TaxID=166010 RepID=A0AAD4MHF8_9BILA|nr:hypothetical protein DdX_19620 [Ditylenchus destructor]
MKCALYLVNHLIPLLAVIANIALVADATVHKIPTQLHRLPANLAKQRLEQRYAGQREMIKLFSRSANQNSAKNGTLPFSASGIIQVANISVGTPPQSFLVEIDWSWYKDMALINSNATSRDGEKPNDELHLYNAR